MKALFTTLLITLFLGASAGFKPAKVIHCPVSELQSNYVCWNITIHSGNPMNYNACIACFVYPDCMDNGTINWATPTYVRYKLSTLDGFGGSTPMIPDPPSGPHINHTWTLISPYTSATATYNLVFQKTGCTSYNRTLTVTVIP